MSATPHRYETESSCVPTRLCTHQDESLQVYASSPDMFTLKSSEKTHTKCHPRVWEIPAIDPCTFASSTRRQIHGFVNNSCSFQRFVWHSLSGTRPGDGVGWWPATIDSRIRVQPLISLRRFAWRPQCSAVQAEMEEGFSHTTRSRDSNRAA